MESLFIIVGLTLFFLFEILMIIIKGRDFVFSTPGNIDIEDIEKVSFIVSNRALTFGGLIFIALSLLIAIFIDNLQSIMNVLIILIYSFSLTLLCYKLEVLTGLRKIFWIIQDKLLSYAFLGLFFSLLIFFWDKNRIATYLLIFGLLIIILIHVYEFMNEYTYYKRRSEIKANKKKPKKELSSAYASLIILFSMLVVNLIIQLFLVNFLHLGKNIVSFFFIISLIPFLFLTNKFIKKGMINFKDIGFIKYNWKSNLVYGLLLGVFVGFLGWFLRYLLDIKTGLIPNGSELYVFILLFFSICISPPLWEEIAFRGLSLNFIENILNMFPRIKNSKLVKNFIIVFSVSILFLIAHFDRTPKSMLVIFVTSLFYTAAYYKTRNIILPITAHFLYNLFVIIQPYFLPIV